jgi:hypothetical protein
MSWNNYELKITNYDNIPIYQYLNIPIYQYSP